MRRTLPWLEALVAALASGSVAVALSSLGNLSGWGRRAETVDQVALAFVVGACSAGLTLGGSVHHALAGSIIGAMVGVIAATAFRRVTN